MRDSKGTSGMTSDVVNIGPEPSLLSPEREAEIRISSRKMGDALARGISAAVDAKVAGMAQEIETLKVRCERLERLLAPRLAEAEGE
jgi:hypothetical protein